MRSIEEKQSIAELVEQLEKAEVIEKVVIYCKPKKKEASDKAPKEDK